MRFADEIYMLHAFQKKSKSGIAIPKAEIDLISDQLAQAERDEREKYVMTKTTKTRKIQKQVEASSGNVFADLGLPHAEQDLIKADPTLQIYKLIKAPRLTQTQAAELLGVQQPQVSLLMRNQAGSFSVGRLLEFLTALGQDVEIRATPADRRSQGEMSLTLG